MKMHYICRHVFLIAQPLVSYDRMVLAA